MAEQMLPPPPARLCSLTRMDAAYSGSSFEPPEKPPGEEFAAVRMWSSRSPSREAPAGFPLVFVSPALGMATTAQEHRRTGACPCASRCGSGGNGTLQRCPPPTAPQERCGRGTVRPAPRSCRAALQRAVQHQPDQAQPPPGVLHHPGDGRGHRDVVGVEMRPELEGNEGPERRPKCLSRRLS